jgi:hypothetical protein
MVSGMTSLDAAAVARLKLLTDAAHEVCPADPNAVLQWLEEPRLGLSGLSPAEAAWIGGVVFTDAVRATGELRGS